MCYEEMVLAGSKLSLDIVNLTANIAVEVHGIQHEKYTKFFQKNKYEFINQLKRDEDKNKWCSINKIQLVEIYDRDMKDLDAKWFLEKHKIRL